jgi:hypothetical protein
MSSEITSPSDEQWLFSERPAVRDPGEPAAAADVIEQRSWGGISALRSVAFVAAGLLLGGAVVFALSHQGTSSAALRTTGASTTTSGQPPAQGLAPNGGGRGGRAGEQHVSGILRAVTGSTVTVATSAGSATYTVTSETQVVRNGALASLSSLVVGDPLFLHIYPATTGSGYLVERLFAGTSEGGFGPGPGGGPPPGGPGGTNA